MTGDCGCEATLLYASGGHSEAGATEMWYCPLHSAAAELLAAAKAAQEHIKDLWRDGAQPPHSVAVHYQLCDAITRAERAS